MQQTFKQVRENNGLSEEELAKRLDLDPATIAAWDRGETIPYEHKAKLATVFGVSADQISAGVLDST